MTEYNQLQEETDRILTGFPGVSETEPWLISMDTAESPEFEQLAILTASTPDDFDRVALAGIIDHTILKPETTPEQVKQVCEEAMEYGFASVCVNPDYIELAVHYLQGSNIPVASVVGFPLGATTGKIKSREAAEAVENGAGELDMVINVGRLRVGDYDYVLNDIARVVEAAGGVVVKVILETCLLSDEEKVKACLLSRDAGAHFVKTSTGFSSGGATQRNVALMRHVVGKDLGVKASGGIRTAADALQMVRAGASRIGASSGVQIVSKK